MPSASRNERRKRRVRRNLTLAKRAYASEALNRVKIQTILLAILAANGGEIYLTKDGIDSAVQSLGKAQYVVEKAEYDKDGLPAPEGTFAVRLVTGNETATATAKAFPSAAELLERNPAEPPAVPATEPDVDITAGPAASDVLDGEPVVLEADNVTTPLADA